VPVQSLSTLPGIPGEKIGWPWTVACPPLPAAMDGGLAWPRISIVTPSYNQAQFVEETVRSILLQGYPNLEYVVLDGGSTDGSVDVLRRYESAFDYWVSAKDNGQASALAAGFRRATGQILGFVNSDDVLLPGALAAVARHFARHPEAELVVGKSVLYDSDSHIIYVVPGLAPSFNSLLFWGSGGFNQPASFWKREVLLQVGIFDESFRFSFDYDMYLRLTRRQPAQRINHYLAAFRMHPASKTSTIQDVQYQDDALLKGHYGIERYPVWVRALASVYYRARYRLIAGTLRLKLLLRLEVVPNLSSQGAQRGLDRG
jgi:glycosyltransferase involved in cell wall biosynthesis